MGAEVSSNRDSNRKPTVSPRTGRGRGDRKVDKPSERARFGNNNVYPVENLHRFRDGPSRLFPTQPQQSSAVSNETMLTLEDKLEAESPDRSTGRGRLAYIKASQRARGKSTTKPRKIPHQAMVNSISVVGGGLGGTTPMSTIGTGVILSPPKVDGNTVTGSSTAIVEQKAALDGQSTTVLKRTALSQMEDKVIKEEKKKNEKLRFEDQGGVQTPKARTQAYTLPKSLHVIPEQPEDESKNPEDYSYSDINIYF
ncbi:uncharacterized protein [Diadema setosum]|uniref:uncharacterized protein n=1 Tax=Diadema setosum TaxID=31175 RepID=UPI003B3B5324